jgi:hypothetical protein
MDWVCAALTIIANELMTRKHRYAWYVMSLNNLFWLYVCYMKGLWAFLALTAVMLVLGIRGLRQWSREVVSEV